jgi:putative FmdB family regulatory protein
MSPHTSPDLLSSGKSCLELPLASYAPTIWVDILSGGALMPQYEFFCKDCQKTFSKILTFAEYDKGNFECPQCHGKNVEQRLAAFYAVTSKKS